MTDPVEMDTTEVEEKEEEEEEPTEEAEQSMLLEMAMLQFLLTTSDQHFPADKKELIKQRLITYVTDNFMGPWYAHLCSTFGWEKNEELHKTMVEKNEKDLKQLDDLKKNSEENMGDTEVREAMLSKAEYYGEIGDKESAVKLYNETLKKTVGSGEKIDVVFALIRLGLCWGDRELTTQSLEQASNLVEKGGDWERRNLLGVYEATNHLIARDFKEAATKLLSAVSTFTCYKLFSYNTFIFYAVVSALVSLDRVTLREKVIQSPDILTVIDEIPNLREFVFSLYECKYSKFFRSLAAITTQIKTDIYLSAHAGYILREIRIVAYSQFLESYRSVTTESMATAFGVSAEFLDKELSRFIAAGRLNCKVDKVRGIVETNRPDVKNAQYLEAIKQGDKLLNQVQKLTKVVHY